MFKGRAVSFAFYTAHQRAFLVKKELTSRDEFSCLFCIGHGVLHGEVQRALEEESFALFVIVLIFVCMHDASRSDGGIEDIWRYGGPK